MGRASKDKRDIYYRKAKEEGWRARSAFKLLQLDETYDLLSGVQHVVDLCAAPGSWSQVLSRRLYLPALAAARRAERDADAADGGGRALHAPALPIIVAVDLQPMAAVEGVVQLQGDITSRVTADAVIAAFGGERADLVVCDGAPDVTGLHDLDEYVQGELIRAALGVVAGVLRVGGSFVAKIFRARDAALLTAQLSTLFTTVHVAKPRSSRNSSVEAFVVCRDYAAPPGFHREMLQGVMDAAEQGALKEENRQVLRQLAPFLACGDLRGWDADRSYDLPDADYQSLPPVQPPTMPAYARALELVKGRKAGHASTLPPRPMQGKDVLQDDSRPRRDGTTEEALASLDLGS